MIPLIQVLLWRFKITSFATPLPCCDHLPSLHSMILSLSKLCQSLELGLTSRLLPAKVPSATSTGDNHAIRCQIVMRAILHRVDRQRGLLPIAHNATIMELHMTWILLSLDLLFRIFVGILLNESSRVSEPLVSRGGILTHAEIFGR